MNINTEMTITELRAEELAEGSALLACQIRPLNLVRSLPGLITMFGMHLLPVLRWRMNWGKHDYQQKHSHFGPLAVDTVYQGKGVGKGLLAHYCGYLDTTNQTGYLETDKAENVVLYQKFGFRIIETDRVLGVENWFMVRQ